MKARRPPLLFLLLLLLLLLLHVLALARCHPRLPLLLSASSSPLPETSPTPLPRAVVLIPGYASDASLYKRLQDSIRARGLPCWTVPISATMWIPTFGGRSIRPILDRIHETVMDVALLGRPLPFPPFTPPPGGGIGVENGESASSPFSPPGSIKVDVEASLAPPPFLPPSPQPSAH